MLEAQEAIKFSDYVKVPPLGTHYTVKWAQDDLREEQKEAAPDASAVHLIEDMETVHVANVDPGVLLHQNTSLKSIWLCEAQTFSGTHMT